MLSKPNENGVRWSSVGPRWARAEPNGFTFSWRKGPTGRPLGNRWAALRILIKADGWSFEVWRQLSAMRRRGGPRRTGPATRDCGGLSARMKFSKGPTNARTQQSTAKVDASKQKNIHNDTTHVPRQRKRARPPRRPPVHPHRRHNPPTVEVGGGGLRARVAMDGAGD